MKYSRKTAQAVFALCMGALGLSTTVGATTTTLNPPYTSVQLFKWSWNDIATECTQWLGPQGYGGVQISPPGAAMSNGNWWDMYQPVNYGALTSRMGTPAQLQTMINTCHAAGVRVYADIVVNQMANGSGTATDGSSWNAGSLSYPQFSSSDFHPFCSIASSDYNNNTYNVQHCWLVGLPDLATEGSNVQAQIENYLETLIGMGVDGFRMDAAKHQQEDQLAIIFGAVKAKYPTTQEGEPLFVTQEIIPDGEVSRTSYEALGTVNEFQFVYAMQAAFRDINGLTPSAIPTAMGTPGNWGGSWGFLTNSNAAQIFVDNWDTERNSGGSLNASDYVSGETNDAVGTYRYDLANIFMLAQPYGVMAQVQSGFRFTGDNQDMPSSSAFSGGVAQVPTSRSQNSGWDFIHRWPDISNMVKFRTATYGLGESNWVTGSSNQIAFSRGSVGFVALNNDSTGWTNTFQTGLPAGTYCNVVNGTLNTAGTACSADSVTVDSSGNTTLSIPANGGGSVVPAVAIYTGQKIGSTVVDKTAPSVPTGLVASAITANGVTLSWTASTDNSGGSGMAGYIVLRNGSKVGSPTAATFTDSGLTAATAYSYSVEAVDNAGNISGPSTSLPVTTTAPDTQAPTAPGTPTATSTSASSVSLSWPAATDNVGVVLYTVYRNGTLAGTSTTASYTDTGVVASTTYAYTVTAADAAGNVSLASASLSVTTPSGNVATVYYQPATSWTTINIHYGINGTWTTVPGVPMTLACTGWYVKAINLGTATALQVVFNNGSGTWDNNSNNNYQLGVGISSIDSGKITTGTSPCAVVTPTLSTPTGLSSSAVTQTGLILSWSASMETNGTLAGYYVYRNSSKVATVTGTSYSDSGLTAATAYSYTVVAYDAAGNLSTASAAYSVTTLANVSTVPTTPTNLAVSNITATGATVSWSASTATAGIAGYQVWATNIAKTTTATSYSLTGLTPATSYNITVRAYDVNGVYSPLATSIKITTLGTADTTPPSQPTGLAMTAATSSTISLQWSASTDNVGVTGYQVWLGNTAVKVTGTSYTFTGLPASTSYNATVRAYDAAGNLSALATALAVKTTGVSVAPGMPSNLAASAISSTGFTLSWTASTGSDAVAGYQVWVGNVATKVSGTHYTVSGLTAATTYNTTVRAYDAAGNWSALVPTVQVTTSQ